jgi:hypothetical protein
VRLKLVALATVLFVVSLQVHAQDSSTGLPTILSDTYGYDFGPYLNGVILRVRTNWYNLMPEIARNGEKVSSVLSIFLPLGPARSGSCATVRHVNLFQ